MNRKRLLSVLLVFSVLVGGVAYAATNTYSAGSTFQTDTGLSITVGTDTDLSGNPFTSSREIDLPGGTVRHADSTGGHLRVDSFDTGSGVKVSNVSGDTVAKVNPDTYDPVGVGGSIGEATWSTIDMAKGNTDVSLTNAGSDATLTFYDVKPDTYYALRDGSGAVVDVARADGSGTVTLSAANTGTADVVEFDNGIPSLSGLSPSGEVLSNTVKLEATVDDDQLPGETVNLTWRVNGNVVHEESVTSPGEYNYTLSSSEIPDSGGHSWSLTATDPYGGEATASSSFGIPANLTVYNVSNTSEVVANYTATVYTDDGAVTKSTTNGTIVLDDIPGGEPLEVEIQADGYLTRTTILPSIIQQQSAYLLPENETAVEDRFTLSDPSGEFPTESNLYIERPVEVNNSTVYRVVAGDQFGVEGVTATLAEGQRYRLRIVSPDGETAVLGKFTAEVAEQVPLRPKSPVVDLGGGQQLFYSANATDTAVSLVYQDPLNETDVLTVSIFNRFNTSEYLLKPTTYYGTNSLSQSVALNQSLSDSYIVVFEGQRGGQPFRATVAIGPDQISVLPGGLSTVWIQIAGSGIVLLVGGLFSRLNVGIGAVTTSLLSGILWYVGLLEEVATGATIAVAIVFSLIYAMVMN